MEKEDGRTSYSVIMEKEISLGILYTTYPNTAKNLHPINLHVSYTEVEIIHVDLKGGWFIIFTLSLKIFIACLLDIH